MVKIEIDGKLLVLDAKQKIRFKLRNPMMYEDVLPKTFSFPFTIPLDNGTNSFLLNYPQIWKNTNKLAKKIDCLVYLFGENNPRKSVLNFNTIQENTAEVNIILDKNVDDIGDKNLSEIDMGIVILENTVKKFVVMRPLFWDINLGPIGDDITLGINDVIYTSTPYDPSDFTLLINQVNAAQNKVVLSQFISGGSGRMNLKIESILAGTDNDFVLDLLHAPFWVMDGETVWMDEHIVAIRDGVQNLISAYNPNTSLVTFPIIENVKFVDDTAIYCGFQNALFTEAIANKDKLNFLTPMLHLVFVMKQVFSFLGYNATGSFFDDENIKRFILYSNVACDHMARILGSYVLSTPPGYSIDKLVNIHSSTITLSRHTPDLTIKEFLTEIRKLFNLSYDYNFQNATVEVFITQTKSNNLIQNAKDFTSKIVNKWQLQNPTATNDTVKLFAFDDDSNDTKKKNQAVLDYQQPLIIDKNAKKEIKPKVSSIAEEMVENFSVVAALQIAGVYNNQGTASKIKLLQYYHTPVVPAGVIVPAWAKMITGGGFFLMPFAFNKDAYPMFAYTSNWSLRWDTDKGFYKKCWEKQAQTLNNGVQLKIAMTFDTVDLLKMQETAYHNLDSSIAIWKDIDVQLGDDIIAQAECLYQLL